MAPVAEAMTFEEKIRLAFVNNMELRDAVKLDGIEYSFYGYATYNKSTDTYHVRWFAVTARKHAGQQEMIGHRGDFDFEDHDFCRRCHPENEETYWESVKYSWSEEMQLYGVTWNPDLTF